MSDVVSGYTDQVTRELLALTEPDPMGTGIDRAKVREMLAEAWDVGYRTGAEDVNGRPAGDPVGNPFEDEAVVNAELSVTYGTDDGTVTISGREDLVAAFLRPRTSPWG